MATIPCPAGSGGNLAAFGDSDYTATSTVGGTTQLPFCDPGPGPAVPVATRRPLTTTPDFLLHVAHLSVHEGDLHVGIGVDLLRTQIDDAGRLADGRHDLVGGLT